MGSAKKVSEKQGGKSQRKTKQEREIEAFFEDLHQKSRKYCPDCGTLMDNVLEERGHGCGGFVIHTCGGCKSQFSENQTGIIANPRASLEPIGKKVA